MTGALMVPKVLGADVELGNFVLGGPVSGSGAEASRALLAAFAEVTGAVGPPDDESATRGHVNPQDRGRRFLPSNGGGAYIDLDHLELTLGEQPSGRDFVAAWHGMLALAQQALHRANEGRTEGRYQALVNNSDGRGNSYGGHLNLLVSRRAWTDVLERKPHLLAAVASYHAASMVVTGQGKVGSENNAPPARFELSQRANFTEALAGPQTTYRRPLCNTRDESHSVPATARLHVICYDSGLAPVGTLLKVGGLQVLMAAVEAGAAPRDLALEDPVEAVQRWSADPLFQTRCPLIDGREVTAVELMGMFGDRLARFVDTEDLADVVPGAEEIMAVWGSTIDLLERGDWSGAARRLDWALKLGMIERALSRRPELDWDSPAVKHLDHLYSSLDPNDGWYWALERAGAVERVVSPAEVERAAAEPSPSTRAWARAMLLRRAPAGTVAEVDWDHIRFRLGHPHGLGQRWRVDLPSPLHGTRAECGSAVAETQDFEELLREIGGVVEPEPAIRSWWSTGQSGRGLTWGYHREGGEYRYE